MVVELHACNDSIWLSCFYCLCVDCTRYARKIERGLVLEGGSAVSHACYIRLLQRYSLCLEIPPYWPSCDILIILFYHWSVCNHLHIYELLLSVQYEPNPSCISVFRGRWCYKVKQKALQKR